MVNIPNFIIVLRLMRVKLKKERKTNLSSVKKLTACSKTITASARHACKHVTNSDMYISSTLHVLNYIYMQQSNKTDKKGNTPRKSVRMYCICKKKKKKRHSVSIQMSLYVYLHYNRHVGENVRFCSLLLLSVRHHFDADRKKRNKQ